MLAFAPDLDETTPDILVEVSAVPTARGYKSPPLGVTAAVDPLPDTSQGGAALPTLTGTTRTIVGTADALYELSGTTWADVSDVGGYTAGADRWWFAAFGDTILAGNKSTQLQASTGADFVEVANTPKMAVADVCAGFLVGGDCDDTGSGLSTGYGDQPHRWWSSQLFNPTGTWAPDVATQATSGLLADTPGAITGMRRMGAQVVAYKARSIYVGDFVGPPVVLQFRVASFDVGCASHAAVVSANFAHYFPGDDNFYAFDGTRPVPIGAGIREWFFARLNRTFISAIQGLHDRANNLIFWFYPTGSDATLNSVVAYHYPSQRWGAFDLTITDVLEAVTNALTYDDLGDIAATYDDFPAIPYNSPFWSSANPILAYFDADDDLQSLSGSGVSMALTTGWQGAEDRVLLCTRVQPRFRSGGKPASWTCAHGTVMQLGDAASTAPTVTNNGDRADVLAAGRYHRDALAFTGYAEVEAIGRRLVDTGEE